VSLPITSRQFTALRALQRADPYLGDLVSDIALAFDASRIENPEMARLILENTCRRIIKRKVGCHKVLIQHLEHFGTLECLSAPQVTDFSERIKKLA
jgi:hypothetical protein